MDSTPWLTKARSKVSPHLRARALWAGLFAVIALLRAGAAPSPPPRTSEGVAAMLGAAVGGQVRSDDFVWEARGGSWSDAFLGRRVLFLARRPGKGAADLYRARVRVSRAGQPLGLDEVRNLTRSALGDDRDLVALGHHAAYATSAFGAVQGVTLLDLAGEGDAREARGWAARAAAAVESWLDTGSTRGIGRTEITFGAPPAEAREELQGELLVMALGRDALPAALDVRDGSLDTGPSNAFAAAAQRVPHRAPALGEVAVRAAREVLGDGAAGVIHEVLERVEKVAGRLRRHKQEGAQAGARALGGGSQAPEAGWPPPAIVAQVQPAFAGEGAGEAGRVERVGEAPPCLFETAIRPDPDQPEALVRLWAMDTRQIDLRLAAGVDEPRSEVGLHGPGRLPDGGSDRVVAAFAGGPAAPGEAPGFVADRRVFVPPAPGMATVAISGDGRAMLGGWGRGSEVPPGMASLRQTPDAIVGWTGPALRPLPDGDLRVERSALGRTAAGQLVYAWSARATAGTLGRALALAGCTYAVPLAAEPAPVGLAYVGAAAGKATAELAAPPMSLSPEGVTGRSPDDLFYVVLRAVSAPTGASFTPDGGRQPSPPWLPALQKAVVVSLGAQVRMTAFAPGRVLFRLRPGAKEPATKAVVGLTAARPEGELGRVLAAVGLASGRKRGARGLIVGGAVGLPFRSEEAGALVVERGKVRIARASEVPPEPPPEMDAAELQLTADDGKLRPEARDVGTMRPRAAACTLEDGTFVVASTTFDSDEAGTAALLDLGCTRVIALDRGTHHAAFVHRAGTEIAPEARYDATVLFAVEAPLSGRAGPLAP